MTARTVLTAAMTAALLLLGPAAALVAAKRPPVPVVKPVTVGGVEYRVEHDRYKGKDGPGGLREYVLARDAKSRKQLWKVMVYDIAYRPGLETDAQDVYITALEPDEKKGLIVRTEDKKKSYRIDLGKKVVETLPAKK
jgi:hypothetical protein